MTSNTRCPAISRWRSLTTQPPAVIILSITERRKSVNVTPPSIFFSSFGNGCTDLGGAAATTAREACASGMPFSDAIRKFEDPLFDDVADQFLGKGVRKAPSRYISSGKDKAPVIAT